MPCSDTGGYLLFTLEPTCNCPTLGTSHVSRYGVLDGSQVLQPCGGKAIEQLLQFALKKRDVQTAAVLARVVSRAQSQKHSPLLSPAVVADYGHVQLAYAEILFRWGLRSLSAEMRQAGTLAVRQFKQTVLSLWMRTSIWET